jgi:hypothetical protein
MLSDQAGCGVSESLTACIGLLGRALVGRQRRIQLLNGRPPLAQCLKTGHANHARMSEGKLCRLALLVYRKADGSELHRRDRMVSIAPLWSRRSSVIHTADQPNCVAYRFDTDICDDAILARRLRFSSLRTQPYRAGGAGRA